MAVVNLPTQLLNRHMAWHMNPPQSGGRQFSSGTLGSGKEFLTFHGKFLQDALAWYATQPGNNPQLVAPWDSIPAELKNDPQTNWNDPNQNFPAKEARITTQPNSFASDDELGIFIETGIHNNFLHGACAVHFHDANIGDPMKAPRSSYFYNIHGLVSLWWKAWRNSTGHGG